MIDVIAEPPTEKIRVFCRREPFLPLVSYLLLGTKAFRPENGTQGV